jgi:hypothetical protein
MFHERMDRTGYDDLADNVFVDHLGLTATFKSDQRHSSISVMVAASPTQVSNPLHGNLCNCTSVGQLFDYCPERHDKVLSCAEVVPKPCV